MLKKWEETLKERNAPFDDLYWDDPIVAYLSDLVDKETIADVLVNILLNAILDLRSASGKPGILTFPMKDGSLVIAILWKF